MNRGDLKDRVQRWVKAGNAAALPIDDVFNDALDLVRRTTHPVDLDVFKVLDVSAAAQVQNQIYSHPLPADLIDPWHVTNNSDRLRSIRSDALFHHWADVSRDINGQNRPYFYAMSGTRTMLTAPGPGAENGLRVGYKSKDADAPLDTDENVGMALFPDVYFWAMMIGAQSFYGDMEAMQVAQSQFDGLRRSVNWNADSIRFGAGGVVNSV